MAYFLKKTNHKGRTYLSIVQSYYHHEKKGTAHKIYRSLSSVETLVASGVLDPISFYQSEVDRLNLELMDSKVTFIGDDTPIKNLGYFPLKAILEKLDAKKYLNYFNISYDFKFEIYDLVSSLIYARAVHPCSKHKTFTDVLPTLLEPAEFSYDQLLDGLEFCGNEYEKIVELFNHQVNSKYKIDSSKTYFDCTNFYFEIDKEDDFRRKGPSKENRRDPIVGLGLLLDANQIPIGMKLYPGNQSEKPILRAVLDDLKKQHKISGKTIHVADKGLNCADNIAYSVLSSDGYIFSKSVKMLPEIEKVWVLLDNDQWTHVKDHNDKLLYQYKSCIDDFDYYVTDINGKKQKVALTEKRLLTYNPTLATKQRHEINRMIEKAKSLTLSQAKKADYGETGKYVNFTDEAGDKAIVSLNQKAIDKDLQYAGYNLLVTSELKMKDQDIYDIYHNLWRIEESFRIMKSDLDARPVYLQLENTIKGHFLICYLTVLLERIFQFHILKNEHSTSEIFKFFKTYQVVKTDNDYINVSKSSDFIKSLVNKFKLPLRNYKLSEPQIRKITNFKI